MNSNKSYTTAHYNDDKIYGNFIQTDTKLLDLNNMNDLEPRVEANEIEIFKLNADVPILRGDVRANSMSIDYLESTIVDHTITIESLKNLTPKVSGNPFKFYSDTTVPSFLIYNDDLIEPLVLLTNSPTNCPIFKIDELDPMTRSFRCTVMGSFIENLEYKIHTLPFPKWVVCREVEHLCKKIIVEQSSQAEELVYIDAIIPPGVPMCRDLGRLCTENCRVRVHLLGDHPFDDSYIIPIPRFYSILCSIEQMVRLEAELDIHCDYFTAISPVLDFPKLNQVDYKPTNPIVHKGVTFPDSYDYTYFLYSMIIGLGGTFPEVQSTADEYGYARQDVVVKYRKYLSLC